MEININTSLATRAALNFSNELIYQLNKSGSVNIEKCIDMRDIFISHFKKNVCKSILAEEYYFIEELEKDHPIQVLNLSMSLGMKLGMDCEQLNDIALASLFHNIGFCMLPSSISNKPYFELTNEEKNLYKLHPILSAKILVEKIAIKKHILDSILQHHEYTDGTGYPQRLYEDQINRNSYIICVTNLYQKILNKKLDNISRTPQQVIKKMLTEYNKKFPPLILHSFAHMFNFNSSETFQNSNDWLRSVG